MFYLKNTDLSQKAPHKLVPGKQVCTISLNLKYQIKHVIDTISLYWAPTHVYLNNFTGLTCVFPQMHKILEKGKRNLIKQI